MNPFDAWRFMTEAHTVMLRRSMALLSAMTAHNWMLMGVWTAVGFLIYFLYGYRHSRLRAPH